MLGYELTTTTLVLITQIDHDLFIHLFIAYQSANLVLSQLVPGGASQVGHQAPVHDRQDEHLSCDVPLRR